MQSREIVDRINAAIAVTRQKARRSCYISVDYLPSNHKSSSYFIRITGTVDGIQQEPIRFTDLEDTPTMTFTSEISPTDNFYTAWILKKDKGLTLETVYKPTTLANSFLTKAMSDEAFTTYVEGHRCLADIPKLEGYTNFSSSTLKLIPLKYLAADPSNNKMLDFAWKKGIDEVPGYLAVRVAVMYETSLRKDGLLY